MNPSNESRLLKGIFFHFNATSKFQGTIAMCGSTLTPACYKLFSETITRKGMTQRKHTSNIAQDTKNEQVSSHGRRTGRNEKAKSPRDHEDLLMYSDSDDSSLGSLGEINQVNSKFILQLPQQLRQDRQPRRVSNDNARLNVSHQRRRRTLIPRSDNSHPRTDSTSSPRIRPGRIFLKPRKSARDEC